MRPTKAQLIELLGRVLDGVATVPPGYLSEAALAGALAVDRRWLRAVRTAGIASPQRLGRGFVYTAAESRSCAVVARLAGLGLEIGEIAAFLEGPCAPEICPGRRPACSAHDCCQGWLRRVVDRLEAEIDGLRGFQGLLAGRDSAAGLAVPQRGPSEAVILPFRG